MTSSRLLIMGSTSLLCLLLPSFALAQHTTESATASATTEPQAEQSFWLGINTSAPDTRGADRNMAFGHSGGTFKIAPKLHTRWGQKSLIEAVLRVDAQDGIYEAGVPLTFETGLHFDRDRFALDLEMGLGFDHVGVASMLLAPNAIGTSWQSTQHMHLGMRYGALSWGVAAGNKRYKASIADHLDLDRRWTFARPYLSWRAHDRLDFELSSQLQWWQHTAPGDAMREGDTSLTHQAAAHIKVTEEMTFHLLGGARKDGLDDAHRPFGGAQITWSPSFGTPREEIAPSSD